MSKYRRIEINAYHRKVTVVSGEWRPGDTIDAETPQTAAGFSLAASDSCEPVAPDSTEGQLILVEAVRTLEQRLSPEGRALLYAGQETPTPHGLDRNGFYFKLGSFFQSVCPRVMRFARKGK